MKILALDPGDVHTGTALTDEALILASPFKTVKTEELDNFLTQLFFQENIEKVVIGMPKTLGGKISQQTEKVEKLKKELEKKFPEKIWISWDERLTSKSATQIQKQNKSVNKNQVHSLAAAIILESYLEKLRFQASIDED